MPIQGKIKGTKIEANLWLPVTEVESSALDQIRNVASLEPVRYVSMMPDVHAGKGACIGSVIAMQDAIAPSLVGVDIGCGMCAVKTSVRKQDITEKKLKKIYEEVKKAIPVGFNSRETIHPIVSTRPRLRKEWIEVKAQFDSKDIELKLLTQLGTLGGGNHFIELEYDEHDMVWLMLHSGSRYVGAKIADYWIKKAVDMYHGPTLPDKSLSYFSLGQIEYNNYLSDMQWAQEYARLNREIMLYEFENIIKDVTGAGFEPEINCHHNFAQVETHYGERVNVIRKGAIEARQNQMGIIPGSMGRDSYIVEGLGNADSLNSAPHGAGRTMSRSKAKKKYTKADVEKTMSGIMCRTDKDVVDEICYSYKPIDKVIEQASDLVKPIAKLQQMMCIKG